MFISHRSEKRIILICKLSCFIFIGLMFKGLWQINTLGSLSWDEPYQLTRTLQQISAGISTLIGSKENLFFPSWDGFDPYGIIQKIPSTLYACLLWFIRDNSLNEITFPRKEYYDFSHLTSLLYAIGSGYLLLKISEIVKLKNIWLAPLFLLSTPLFNGHSLFNIKDIPFAFFFTFFTWALIKIYQCQIVDLHKRNIALALVSGALCTLKMTIFPIIIAEVFICYFLIYKHKIKPFQNFTLTRFFSLYFIFFIICASTVVLLMPASWQNPLSYLYRAFFEFKDFTIDICMNFDGKCQGKGSTPNWTFISYIFRWASIKLSLLNILSISISFIIILRTIHGIILLNSLSLKNYARLIFGMQLSVIPILAILVNSNVYDGLRHFLFVFPAMSYLGAEGIIKLLEKNTNKIFNTIIYGFIITSISLNFIDSAALSPYQYTYFNQFSRTRHLKAGTDLDYWGVSVGELYKNSKNKINIFPDDQGPAYNFVQSNNIDVMKSNENFTSEIIFRPPPLSINLPKTCTPIESVTRKYPLSNQIVKISSLIVCPNKS